MKLSLPICSGNIKTNQAVGLGTNVVAGLTLAVLGVPEFRFGGAAVSLPAKSQALVIYLAMTGKRARREMLADMFWGDTGDDGARANLRLALSKLRQSLPGVLEADADSVGLVAAAVPDVDALQLLQTVDTLLQQSVAAQEAAIARYRGPFLQDFMLRDCAEFEDWVTAERQRIDRRAVVLLRELAHAARRGGKTEREIHHLGLWAQIEPWNEEVQLPLIKLLAQAGSTAAALDRYESCRKAAAEELGARPSVALALLAEQVRRGELGRQPAMLPAAPGVEHHVPAPTALPAPPPEEPVRLYGRDADLRRVAEKVTQGERLVTLLGPAGIGKSRLARALTQNLAGDYPDGQVACSFDFVDSGLDGQDCEAHFVDVLGSALGLNLALTAQPMAMLKTHLATRRFILGLDGFEACVQAAPALVELLHAAPQCLLLVTSRTRLPVAQGWTHEIRGLAAPADPMEQAPALDLLMDCARRAGVVLDGVREHETLTRLVRLLDGSPLAIHFAAQSLRLLSAPQLVNKLEKGGWPDSSLHVPGYRYSTLQDVMDDIWEQLEPTLQEAWVRCGLFKGTFSLDWAHDCAGVSDRQITMLVERSIVVRELPGRLSMHALIRQHGLQMLDAMPAAAEYRRVFQQGVLARLVGLSPQLVREDATGALDVLRPEIATVESAFDMALQTATPEELQPALQALQRVYHRLGWSQAALRLMEAVLAHHSQASAPWRVIWHQMAGAISHNQHGWHRDSEHLEAAVALAGVVVPPAGPWAWVKGGADLFHSLFARAHASPLQRNAQRALTHALTSLVGGRYANGAATSELFTFIGAAALAARRSASPEARISVLLKFMAIEWIARRPRAYTRMLRRVQIDLKFVDPAYEAYVYRHMAYAMMATGQWDGAHLYLQRASSLLSTLGYGYDALESHSQRNIILLHKGDFRQLLDNVWAEEREARRLEQPTILRFTLLFKLQCWLRTGSVAPEVAAECLRAIHSIPTAKVRLEECRLLANEALVLAAQGDVAGVMHRAQAVLELVSGMSGGRFIPLAPLAVMTDAMLHVATSMPQGQMQELPLAAQLVARYAAMTGSVDSYLPRSLLYQGTIAALQGDVRHAMKLWQRGLASCKDAALRYDMARLHWMLGLHGPDEDTQGHLKAAAAHFEYCGVEGPPYPFMPGQRVQAQAVRSGP
jgi:DNA-binding SARP family transcriptional activator/tetratricopeptide (TPR) repeat protein